MFIGFLEEDSEEENEDGKILKEKTVEGEINSFLAKIDRYEE